MVLYKVLKRRGNKLYSPFQEYEYKPGREYVCKNFDADRFRDCSYGYYATGIDGIIYTFRNLPDYEVWEVEVGGRSVEIDQFKRRYENIKLIRLVPFEEVRELALAEEERVGYKLAEALFPINPLKIKAGPVTSEEIALLKQWASVRASVKASIWDSVEDSIEDSVWSSTWDFVWTSVRDLVGCSVERSVVNLFHILRRTPIGISVVNSVRDSSWAYISSLFPRIKKWKYIKHPEGENPFQPGIDLWHKGLVPGFDGKRWRLYAGEKAEIVWEGTEKALEGGGE